MRLWHIDLIPYLPKGQLVAQWRELNSIFKKEDKHILINYIYNYPKDYLLSYADKVINEMQKRGYKIRSFANFNKYFAMIDTDNVSLDWRYEEHDLEYLIICYYNLKEKWMRGQKDFTDEVWYKIHEFKSNALDLFIKKVMKK